MPAHASTPHCTTTHATDGGYEMIVRANGIVESLDSKIAWSLHMVSPRSYYRQRAIVALTTCALVRIYAN